MTTEDSKIDSMISKQLELTEVYLVKKYELQVKKDIEDIKRDISDFRRCFRLGLYNYKLGVFTYESYVHEEALPILAEIYGVVKIECIEPTSIYNLYKIKFGDSIDSAITKYENELKRLKEIKETSATISI
jgi:hypothetical protein